MAEVKQYINLEPSKSDPRLGRAVHAKSKISVKKARTVHLWLKPDGKNVALTDLPAGDRGGLPVAGSLHQARMTEPDGTVKFDLLLSVEGGDKFSVEVSRDRAGKKKIALSDAFVVWRRLYFQLSRMKTTYAFPAGTLKGEYAKHFIELEETSAQAVPHKQNLETPELPGYRQFFKGVKLPFEAHVVLIDRQCDSRIRNLTGSMNMRTKVYALPPGTEDWPFADWLVQAQWRAQGQSWQAGAAVTRVIAGGGPALRVDLTSIPVDPTKTPVDIQVRVKTLKGEYTGDATFKPHVFIAVGKPRSANSVCKTVAHEIGHGVGMVPVKDHALQYDNANGGMGSHCRDGATPSVPSKAQKGTFTGEYAHGTCVMFAFSSEHFPFCSTCAKFVRKARLFKGDMQARGW